MVTAQNRYIYCCKLFQILTFVEVYPVLDIMLPLRGRSKTNNVLFRTSKNKKLHFSFEL